MQKTREVKEDGSYTEVSTDQQNSIEISVNAKNDLSYKVKVYKDDPIEQADTLADFLKIAEATKSAHDKANGKE